MNLGRPLQIAVFSAFILMPAAHATPPPLPHFPPLVFHPPKPEKFVLENGLTVFLLEDHELPLIKVSALIRTGTQYEPPDKVGLGGIFSDAMTEGGALTHTPEEIERILDENAATISFGMDTESGSAAMSCRAQDFSEIFGIFSDLLQHPLFRNDRLALAKAKALESLRRMNDDPEDETRREFRIVMYGKDHPYARVPSPATIQGVRREDLLEWHRHYYHPNAVELAISGDFQSAAMKEALRRALGGWPKGSLELPPVAPVVPPPEPRLFYIQRAIDQSQIRIGSLGLVRHSPDHFAWEVFNELWGGSAVSALFQTVRTRLGLAYAVGSAYSEPAERGLIVAVSQTRAPETVAAAQAILEVSENARQANFTANQIKGAKESIENRFVENYASSDQIASEIMSEDYFGYPPDYLDAYTGHIAAVTPADLKRVGAAYLHPDQSTVLIVGDPSTFLKPLSALGKPQPLKPVDYSQGVP